MTLTTACASYELEIDAPSESRIDEEIEITVRGADPGEEIEVTAETHDAEGNSWSADAVYTAGSDGTLRLAEAEPLSGSYDEADPMGLFWSMEPDEDSDRVTGYLPPIEGMKVVLTAETNAGSENQVELLRGFGPDEAEMKWIAENGVVGDYFSPDTDEELPGVILLHGAPARRMNFESMVLASHGYRVFAPLYFQPENEQQLGDHLKDVSDLPETLDERPIEYVQDAIEWLRSRPDVADEPVGVGGVSRGGELALIAGEYVDGIGAIVSWHSPGFPQSAFLGVSHRSPDSSAWSFEGEPLRYLRRSRRDVLETTIDASFVGEESIEPADMWQKIEPMVDDELQIRLENSEVPVLLISGIDDLFFNAAAFQEAVVEHLQEIDYELPFEHRYYQDAGHSFFLPYLPQYTDMGLAGAMARTPGGAPAGDAAAAADSWPRALEYFRMGAEEDF